MMNSETSQPHAIFGVFHKENSSSLYLLKDLKAAFGSIQCYILYDESPQDPVDESYIYRNNLITTFHKQDVLEWLASHWQIDVELLVFEVQRYKLILKILFGYYLHHAKSIDYAILTDNDIFLFEPVPEIVALSSQKTAFFIEQYALSKPQDITATEELIRQLCPINPEKKLNRELIGSLNVGFCGLHLNIYNFLSPTTIIPFLQRFSLGFWEREQVLTVLLTYFFQNHVVALHQKERYSFQLAIHEKNRDLYLDTSSRFRNFCSPIKNWKLPIKKVIWSLTRSSYQRKSKIFHCIGTTNKKFVDMLYAKRYGQLNARRYNVILHYLQKKNVKKMLEIGLWRGDTSELFLMNSQFPDFIYFGIDLFENSSPEIVEKEVSLIANSESTIRSRLAKSHPNVTLLRGFSHSQLRLLLEQKEKFDCIWIDGGHSYETVKDDFHQSLALLSEKEDAIIFLDDYTTDPILPDVKKFVDAELLTNPQLKVIIHHKFHDVYRRHSYHIVSVQLASVPGARPIRKKTSMKPWLKKCAKFLMRKGLNPPPKLMQAYHSRQMFQKLKAHLAEKGWVRSIAEQQIVDRLGNPVPWITYAACRQLESLIRPHFKVFEYGAGFSSLWWADKVAEVVSVDHDYQWWSKLEKKKKPNQQIFHIPRYADLSSNYVEIVSQYPCSHKEREYMLAKDPLAWEDGYLNLPFLAYSAKILDFPPGYFDVVVVDGMARNLSAWIAASVVSDTGMIIFDNSDRAFYKESFDLLEQKGFLRVDFWSLGPFNTEEWCTSIFLSKKTVKKGFLESNQLCGGI